MKKIFHFLQGMVVLGFLLAIARFWVKKQMQTDPSRLKRSRKLTKTDRREIQAALDEMARKTLTPREEVIFSYQIFLKIMDAAGRGREEYLPPTDYCHRLQENFSALKTEFQGVTEVFCETLYGERAVEAPKLGSFRQSFREVTRFFL